MRFKGNPNAEELSDLLKDESNRGVVIVGAAFFDETLARLLGDTHDRSFFSRINDARDYTLLTDNEHNDLHEVRKLRNRFAHNLRAAQFDPATQNTIESMKTWQIASTHLPQYHRLFPGPRERFLYVVGMIAFRLQHRTSSPPRTGPLPEPPFTDTSVWPIVVGL